jgi:hypothetical protein
MYSSKLKIMKNSKVYPQKRDKHKVTNKKESVLSEILLYPPSLLPAFDDIADRCI